MDLMTYYDEGDGIVVGLDQQDKALRVEFKKLIGNSSDYLKKFEEI
jgi:hypothetical protein